MKKPRVQSWCLERFAKYHCFSRLQQWSLDSAYRVWELLSVELTGSGNYSPVLWANILKSCLPGLREVLWEAEANPHHVRVNPCVTLQIRGQLRLILVENKSCRWRLILCIFRSWGWRSNGSSRTSQLLSCKTEWTLLSSQPWDWYDWWLSKVILALVYTSVHQG